MPTASAEGWIESEGGIGEIMVIMVFRYRQIGTGPRRSPSACSETLKKKNAPRTQALRQVDRALSGRLGRVRGVRFAVGSSYIVMTRYDPI